MSSLILLPLILLLSLGLWWALKWRAAHRPFARSNGLGDKQPLVIDSSSDELSTCESTPLLTPNSDTLNEDLDQHAFRVHPNDNTRLVSNTFDNCLAIIPEPGEPDISEKESSDASPTSTWDVSLISYFNQKLHPGGDNSVLVSSERREESYSQRLRDKNDEEIVNLKRLLTNQKNGDCVERARFLNELGRLFVKRYMRSDDLMDIERAISSYQMSVDLIPDDNINKPSWLNDLGCSLRKHFEHEGDMASIDTAILRHEQAVDLTSEGDDDKPSWMSNLGSALLRRFERQGKAPDINKAILIQQQAVDLTPDTDNGRPARLTNLGNSLNARFQQQRQLADIHNAILVHEQAVDLTPNGNADKPARLHNLGISLQLKYNHIGDLADIDRAILLHNQAVDLTPESDLIKPTRLTTLGSSLEARFARLKNTLDIDNAIAIHQQAVALTSDGHTLKPTLLSNLSNSLLTRYESLENQSDMDNAISHYQRAVDLTPDGHMDKPAWLSNLGGSLLRRFERQSDENDIKNSILMQQRAVDLTQNDHSTKPDFLTNLALTLITRFTSSRNQEDINQAIHLQTQAIELIPDGHARKPLFLDRLAAFFQFQLQDSFEPTTYAKLISCSREAAISSSGPPLHRFEAALRWASVTYPALTPHETIINLIPQLVWVGKTVQQRFKDLQTLGNAAMDAASAACIAGNYDQALEWLEQGRAIIWGQILQLRSPMDDLEATHPQLAQELNEVADALEIAGTSGSGPGANGSSLENATQAHHRLAARWEQLLKTIRALPQFENFLRPKSAAALKTTSAHGAIVVVNVSTYQSDALILRPGSSTIEHLALPTLSYEKLNEARENIVQSLYASGVRARGVERQSMPGGRSIRYALPMTLKMLWTDVAKPITEHLGYMTPPSTGKLPHVTWCLTGPLASLPLHAAGIYSRKKPNNPDKLFNYVVSSYTPSLTSLLEDLHQTLSVDRSALAVTQVDTPGLSRLPGTMVEVDQVEKQMQDHQVHLTRVDGVGATVSMVSTAMDTHNWVHLSCHGKQDVQEPTKSAFFLHDGTLELGEIMKKDLQHAELAYLSACQTASGDATLPDEAVHLAAGMFIAGYRSVVATLWSIGDSDAPLVAQVFYDRLLCNPEDGTAQALHNAVGVLRKKVGEMDLLSWVPYMHMGH